MTGLSAVTLSNVYAEHILRKARLDELQFSIKIGRDTPTASDMQMISL